MIIAPIILIITTSLSELKQDGPWSLSPLSPLVVEP